MRSASPPGGAPGTQVPRAALITVIAVASLGLLAVVLPEPPNAPTLCLFKAVTGRPCPGCGFLRAARLLVRANVHGAFITNPLATAVMLLAPPAALLWTILRARGTRVTVAPPRGARAALWWFLGAVVGANWVYVLAAGR